MPKVIKTKKSLVILAYFSLKVIFWEIIGDATVRIATWMQSLILSYSEVPNSARTGVSMCLCVCLCVCMCSRFHIPVQTCTAAAAVTALRVQHHSISPAFLFYPRLPTSPPKPKATTALFYISRSSPFQRCSVNRTLVTEKTHGRNVSWKMKWVVKGLQEGRRRGRDGMRLKYFTYL